MKRFIDMILQRHRKKLLVSRILKNIKLSKESIKVDSKKEKAIVEQRKPSKGCRNNKTRAIPVT